MIATQQLLEEIELEQALKKAELYKSFVYQPERLSISSQNATAPTSSSTLNPSQSDNSYYNFNINLPRPLLNVKSLQLLRASIPQCSPSIQDTALVFWYYRLQTQLDINGDTYFTELPNISNLYCVRLLPSYYKHELIDTPSQYGFNQTFNSYQDLLTQLNLATINDLAYNNQVSKTMPFISGDITFSFNSTTNRFSVTGNNVNTSITFNTYSAATTYNLNNIVSYLGNNYICKVSSSFNVIPTNTTNWAVYVQTSNFYTYLLAGYSDPNVITKQVTVNSISQTYDFELLACIPGQPYLSTPLTNRTLNLILGFTWNGLNYQLSSLVTPTIYLAGSPAPLLFNRLRPIPIYASTDSLLGTYPQTSTGTYSADAYCNMVFSSIISIYCSIVAAATLDTQRNTNLLAIIPMNCPNLGVTFYNNVINNELTKVNNDIYTLYIELRAEDGSPYLISNNGIISLDLKLTY